MLRILLSVLALAATFQLLAVFGVNAVTSPGTTIVFFGVYLLFAGSLVGALALGRHLGRAAGFAAALASACAVVWHCRELTYRPDGLAATAAVAVLLAVPIDLLWRRGPAPLGPWGAAALLAGAALGTAVAVGAVFHGSDLLRWHLLQHHKMLGTPAYYVLADDVESLERELFERYRGEVSVPAVDLPVAPSPTARPPHLVYLMLDTLRADALELGGGPRDVMPRMNAFLDDAWRFTDVLANASWTRPSLASLLTGLTPEEHGARDVDEPLEEGFTTLAEVLQASGYETTAFVSNYGAAGTGAGFAQGFDAFYELKAAKPYARAGQIRGLVERWLDERGDSERPLFLYLHFLDPHEPYLAGAEPTVKSRAQYQDAYRAELAYLDEELAALLELLNERLPGEKAVFVTSDHGEEFFEHEEFGHGYSLYPEVTHVPVAFHTGAGGGESGGQLAAPLEGRDFFDLLTRWVAAEDGGGDLDVPAWAEERRRGTRHTSVYYSSEGRLLLRPYLSQVAMRAVESDGHLFIWSAYGDTRELYDVGRDPGAFHNLVGAAPDLAERLGARLDPTPGLWYFARAYDRSAEDRDQLRDLGYLD